MARELEGQAACVTYAVAKTARELDVNAVTWREVGARLGDADDGSAALQLLASEPKVEVPVQREVRT